MGQSGEALRSLGRPGPTVPVHTPPSSRQEVGLPGPASRVDSHSWGQSLWVSPAGGLRHPGASMSGKAWMPCLVSRETGSGRVPFKLTRHRTGLGEQGGSLLPLPSLEHPPKEGSLAFGGGPGGTWQISDISHSPTAL